MEEILRPMIITTTRPIEILLSRKSANDPAGVLSIDIKASCIAKANPTSKSSNPATFWRNGA